MTKAAASDELWVPANQMQVSILISLNSKTDAEQKLAVSALNS